MSNHPTLKMGDIAQWVNGERIGIVKRITKDCVFIEMPCGKTLIAGEEEVEKYREKINER